MNLLAFDTSTDALSIAVSRTEGAQRQLWQHSGVGGAQASSTLIAAIMDVMAQAGLAFGALDAICFGSGPGSFTGLRTACAVAQGLAYGARVPVLPVESLLAVAEEARHAHFSAHPDVQISALLDARMDEIYAASYVYAQGQWTTLHASHLVQPEAFIPDQATHALAGNVFTPYGARLHTGYPGTDLPRLHALPTAAAMLRVAAQLLQQGKAVAAAQALPLYIRDKVAQTTAERAAEKAAKLARAVSHAS